MRPGLQAVMEAGSGYLYFKITARTQTMYKLLLLCLAMVGIVLPRPAPAAALVLGVNTGSDYMGVADATGMLFMAGKTRYSSTGCDLFGIASCANPEKTFKAVRASVRSVAMNGTNTLAVDSDGSLWVTGDNGGAQLGTGDFTARATWTNIPALSGAKTVAAGLYHSVLLKSDGTVWGAGSNMKGELGLTAAGYKTAWTQVAADAKDVVARNQRVFVIKNDGTLLVSGEGQYGEIGVSVPATGCKCVMGWRTSSLTDVKKVSAGYYFTLYLKNDGTVWASGNGGNGQFGNGTNPTKVVTPIQVAAGVMDIAAGGAHTLILRSNGRVESAGAGGGGLALGTGVSSTNTFTDTGIANVVAIAASGNSSYALDANGDLWVSGDNGMGQLGDGTMTHRYNWTKIAFPGNLGSAGPFTPRVVVLPAVQSISPGWRSYR